MDDSGEGSGATTDAEAVVMDGRVYEMGGPPIRIHGITRGMYREFASSFGSSPLQTKHPGDIDD